MHRMQILEQFEDLRMISENVTDYLSRELFKDTFGASSDYTVNDVLRECYAIILQELVDFGISFTLLDDDLLEDWYTCKHIFYVRKFVDITSLKLILSNPEDIDKIESLLESDEVDTDFFGSMFDILYETRQNVYEFQVMEYIVPFVMSNDQFKAHVKAIIQNLRDIDAPVIIPDVDRAKKYIEKTMQLREYARNAVDKIISNVSVLSGNLDMKKIEKLLRDYDMDKIAADQIKIYSVVDLGEINESMEKYQAAMMQIHHERSPHHIEYWIAPWKIPVPIPTTENLVLLVAHHMEPDTTAPEFWDEIREMLNKGIAVFTSEQVDLINQMALAIFPNE